jgi:hypothetical protein
MKVFLLSSAVAIAVAFIAHSVLINNFQMDSKTAFTTGGARPTVAEPMTN